MAKSSERESTLLNKHLQVKIHFENPKIISLYLINFVLLVSINISWWSFLGIILLQIYGLLLIVLGTIDYIQIDVGILWMIVNDSKLQTYSNTFLIIGCQTIFSLLLTALAYIKKKWILIITVRSIRAWMCVCVCVCACTFLCVKSNAWF